MKLVVSCLENLGIGYKNQTPWSLLRPEMKRFKDLTDGQCIVMGRRNFETVGVVLKNRRNIVLSKSLMVDDTPVDVNPPLPPGSEVLLLSDPGLVPDNAIVVGGAEIYRLFMPRVETIYLTWIRSVVELECDAWMPEFRGQFEASESGEWKMDPGTGLDYRFCVYRRKEVK